MVILALNTINATEESYIVTRLNFGPLCERIISLIPVTTKYITSSETDEGHLGVCK